MKEVQKTITYYILQAEDLSQEEAKLLQQAGNARAKSFSPYSQFAVGAAVVLQSGRFLLGANQENAAYPLCICAEQNVLSTWGANHSDDPILKMAIVAGPHKGIYDKPVPPCGACRQSMLEYTQRQGSHFKVLLRGISGPIFSFERAVDLLPLAFDSNHL